MVFDKIKEAFGGGDDSNEHAEELGQYSEYGKYLSGVTFPATKEEVLAAMRDNGAGEGLEQHVESMSQERFESPRDVFKTVGA